MKGKKDRLNVHYAEMGEIKKNWQAMERLKMSTGRESEEVELIVKSGYLKNTGCPAKYFCQ